MKKFKKLLAVVLAISVCVSMTAVVSAAPSVASDVLFEETIYPNGDQVWYVTENGKTSTVNIYHDQDYILVDGEQIFPANEITILHNETTMRSIPQPLANPKWVYIRSESCSAETQRTFNDYTAAILGGIIGSYFGMPGSIAVSVAATAISRASNENVMDLERDIYGNQYALNHYKNEDSYYAGGTFIKTAIWYNPAIY